MPLQANSATLSFVVDYCKQHLGTYGFSALYLIGSRAYGTPRPNSDHDFIAVVNDCAPQGVITGGELHLKIFDAFDKARRQAGLSAIDLLITRHSDFQCQVTRMGTFAHAAITKGHKVV